MGALTSGLDLSTRYFWRTVGRPVEIAGQHHWLDSPHTARGGVGDDWLVALERNGQVRSPGPRDGLVESMADSDGPAFTASRLHPLIRDFYEHTASWRMEVWSQWNALLAPGGELIARAWGRRVEQLALPVQPLSVSRGMSSVVRVVDDHGISGRCRLAAQPALRRFQGVQRLLPGGRLPGNQQPHVYVSFPLESGSIQVYLAPRVDPDGSFWLESRSQSFGGDGAYAVVRFANRWYASMTPIREKFHVFVDDEGTLRTDHWLRLGRWQALRLHYRLDRHA